MNFRRLLSRLGTVAPTALVALHVVKTAAWLRRVDWISGVPLLNVDYAQFYGRALRAHAFLSDAGRLWGYDPFDMAGYVSGPFLEVGVQLFSLVAHLLSPFLSVGTSMLLLEAGGFLAAPFVVNAAVRALGGNRAQSWAAFGIVVLFWGYLEPFSERFLRVGLFGFMMAGFVSLLQVGWCWRWLSEGRPKDGALLCVLTAALFGIHPASLVIVAVPNLVLFAAFAQRLGWKRAAATVAFAALAAALNFYWIVPFVAFSEWKTDAPYFVTRGLPDLARTFFPSMDAFSLARWAALVGALVLAVAALRDWHRRNRALAVAFELWLLWLFAAAFFGSALPGLRALQPGRNVFPFWLTVAFLAGWALPERLSRAAWRGAAAAAVFAALAGAMLVSTVRDDSAYPPFDNRLPAGQEAFIDALTSRMPIDGRVLIECVDASTPHLADLMPFRLPGLVLLGGQHPGNFTQGRFSLFSGAYNRSDGYVQNAPTAFNRPMSEMGAATFEGYLRLYNVAFVAVRTEAMRGALDRYDGVLGPADDAGDYSLYPVLSRGGWFEGGSGRVSFAFDRITIDEAARGRLVLKAHWIKTMRVEPAVPLEPVSISDDPVPFILIDNSAGHSRLVVYNGGL